MSLVKKKKQLPPQWRGQKRKGGKKVPIAIKGLGTFYVSRKIVLISALLGTLMFIGIAAWLWWLWTIRIPSITGGG